ncbi:MAG: ABC transporter permease [Lachnospiraceae bacterium]|jgi:peptide/nickel transport system permease protein|nr:ABC transporter permease [Lachnospiraceae bacterium]NBJ83492.1 ABC transporter permease [bacterium 1XD42-76]NBK06782.1 ABC transporter permease [bacterium 1XD42-94]
MGRYILKRLLMMIPVLLSVVLLIFILQFITPGDPAKLQLGTDATNEEIENWHEKYGLNDPFAVQFTRYVWGIVSRGDFGNSWRNGQPITQEIISRWPTTFLLAILTTLVSVISGTLLGIYAALHRGSLGDAIARVIGILGISLPNFWFALMMILLFAVRLQWLPVSGFYGPLYWILPAGTLGVLGASSQMRITRSAMLDNINADFVRTARAKGQEERVITYHHILRNALIPILTNVGSRFAQNLTGTMILEQIFAIPGIGTLMVLAINKRDYPQLRASVILVAATVSVVNLLIDIAYAAADPRVKATFKSSSGNFLKFKKRAG